MSLATKIRKSPTPYLTPELPIIAALPPRARTLRYVGGVTRALSERVLKGIEDLLEEAPEDEIGLFVSSTGGPTGVAMSFFDTIHELLHPRLVTIGSGDVDSSGVIIFLTGERRYLSARTTLLLHPAGRFFGNQRYTAKEMEAMLVEDRLKDHQYAATIVARSEGKLSLAEVEALMEKHTVLDAVSAVRLGLAHAVLP